LPPGSAPSGTTAGGAVERSLLLGRSIRGRPILLVERASGQPGRVVLVVGCIHGTECAGLGVTRRLLSGPPPKHGQLWVIPNLNPDGYALGVRGNARGVDLNRNFPSEWRPIGQPGDPQYSGPRPLSERETRLALRAVARVRPAVSIWFHQPQDVVRAWGQSIPFARRYARLAGAHFRRIRWPSGTASNWQNHRFPGTASFVVELAAGTLPGPSAARYARAVQQLL
jgi:protein MpaA